MVYVWLHDLALKTFCLRLTQLVGTKHWTDSNQISCLHKFCNMYLLDVKLSEVK